MSLLSGKPSACPGSDSGPNHRLQARLGFAWLFVVRFQPGLPEPDRWGHMKALRTFAAVVCFCLVWVLVAPVSGASPDERDRQVLETLLLHLLNDPKLDLTTVPANNGANVVLHVAWAKSMPRKAGTVSNLEMWRVFARM
jgi:hypothetical protein